MLVLGRKASQRVVLQHEISGETIVVTVVSAVGSVRLGFEAPQGWKILREELVQNA